MHEIESAQSIFQQEFWLLCIIPLQNNSVARFTPSLSIHFIGEAFGSQKLVQVIGPTSRMSFKLENVVAGCRLIL